MRRHRSLQVLLFACAVGSVACSSGPPAPAEIELALGHPVRWQDLELEWQSFEDSRCPRDAVCVWAGRAAVVLSARSGTEHRQMKLARGATGDPDVASDATFATYRIVMIELLPYPVEGSVPDRAERRLVVTIARSAGGT